MKIKEHLGLLGYEVRDRVTGYEGVCTSICFDLYGCIQSHVTPKKDKDGKLEQGKWFDVSRLVRTGSEPVIELPNYDFGLIADGKHGPDDKPSMDRY